MREQTTLTLADRAAAYNAQNPGEEIDRQALGKIFKRLGVKKRKVQKKKCNPRKYTPAIIATLKDELQQKVLAADAEDRWIWNVDEVHFKLSDHQRFAWAMPNELPVVPEKPWRGMKTCSVLAAICVQTGEILIDLQKKF